MNVRCLRLLVVALVLLSGTVAMAQPHGRTHGQRYYPQQSYRHGRPNYRPQRFRPVGVPNITVGRPGGVVLRVNPLSGRGSIGGRGFWFSF
jgi:hypothetical protein